VAIRDYNVFPGGSDGQVLVWDDNTDDWIPEPFVFIAPGGGFVGIGTGSSSLLLNRNTNVLNGTGGPATPATGVVFAADGPAEFNGDVTSSGDFYITSDEKLKTDFVSLNT